MSKRTVIAFFILLAALFFVMNRGAYKGYFSDDEIDNLSWTPHLDTSAYAKAMATPRFIPDNFRPAGHLYFKLMERSFGLDFPKYAASIHLLHLLNVWLLWALLRRLEAPPGSAAAGVLFFAFHMALFEALWKPMYVFDVLCATLCLAAFIFYIDRRWIPSFLAFWLAYKSKEMAVMLPGVLLAYEWWLGRRSWKPLVPFFAASLSFGLQGILLNPNRDNDYTFRFTPAALATTSVFYARRVLLVPYAGFALLAVPWLTRHRRAWLGLSMAGLLFVPMLFLPGRLFGAYCYVPFTGLAVAVSAVGLESRRAQALAAAALLLWLPWNYYQMRLARRGKLAKDDEVRTWVTTLEKFSVKSGPVDAFVYAGAPAGFNRWGIEGAIKYFYKRGDLQMYFVQDRGAQQALHSNRFAMLTWDHEKKALAIAAHTPETPDAAHLTMDPATPVWQLGDGWFALEGTYRWTQPRATAMLSRPAGVRRFEVRVNVGAEQMKQVGPQQLTVTVGGLRLEPRRFPKLAWQVERWDVPAAPAGDTAIVFEVEPGFRPDGESRNLGLAIGSFGFVEETQK